MPKTFYVDLDSCLKAGHRASIRDKDLSAITSNATEIFMTLVPIKHTVHLCSRTYSSDILKHYAELLTNKHCLRKGKPITAFIADSSSNTSQHFTTYISSQLDTTSFDEARFVSNNPLAHIFNPIARTFSYHIDEVLQAGLEKMAQAKPYRTMPVYAPAPQAHDSLPPEEEVPSCCSCRWLWSLFGGEKKAAVNKKPLLTSADRRSELTL